MSGLPGFWWGISWKPCKWQTAATPMPLSRFPVSLWLLIIWLIYLSLALLHFVGLGVPWYPGICRFMSLWNWGGVAIIQIFFLNLLFSLLLLWLPKCICWSTQWSTTLRSLKLCSFFFLLFLFLLLKLDNFHFNLLYFYLVSFIIRLLIFSFYSCIIFLVSFNCSSIFKAYLNIQVYLKSSVLASSGIFSVN